MEVLEKNTLNIAACPSSKKNKKRILTSDIGGTNSRFALFEADTHGELTFIESIWLKTGDATSFENLLHNLESSSFHFSYQDCDAIVVAVPGPVQNKTVAHLSNVPWEVDITPLRQTLGPDKIFLINDFVAQAYACRTRAIIDAIPINNAIADPLAPVAVIGAGTGLGHCALVPSGDGGLITLPSEAGHQAFPFVDEEEEAYENFLLRETKLPYIYNEIVVSGRGLTLAHKYHTGELLRPWEVTASIAPDSLTAKWFARFYARVCRHYSLAVLPFGGMYIAGGVASKNRHLVLNDAFRAEFVNSPTMRHILERIPFALITNEESGLWGAAFYGLLNIGMAPLLAVRHQ